jgi:Protein of unknown function (DUF2514)
VIRLLLGLLPAWAWLAVAAALLAGAGVWHLSAVHDARAAGMQDVQGRWDAARAVAAETARVATEAARAEEQRRIAALMEIANESALRAEQSRVAALAADAAAVGLRQRAAAIAARCSASRGHPSPAASGPPAADPGRMLADVLGRLEEAGRELAAIADQRGAAGAACQTAYDALRGAQTP